jgi:hypothetical protein
MTDRDDTATVDPRTAARKRALEARLVILVVMFIRTYNRSILQHNYEVNEIIAIGLRTVKENIRLRDESVTDL